MYDPSAYLKTLWHKIVLTFQNVSHNKEIVSGEENIESRAKFHYSKVEQVPLGFSEWMEKISTVSLFSSIKWNISEHSTISWDFCLGVSSGTQSTGLSSLALQI